jgi:hypothetical protein
MSVIILYTTLEEVGLIQPPTSWSGGRGFYNNRLEEEEDFFKHTNQE